MLRGRVAWKFLYIHCLVSVFVFGHCRYLLDLVLSSRGRLAFLRVAQSGLWDGLRDFNGLVAFTDLNTYSFLTVSFCFDCIAHAVILDHGICVWFTGGSVGGSGC